jgi:diadenylate cyclase
MRPMIDIFTSWFSLMPRLTVTGFFEIAIIAWLVYEILLWIMNTRAWVLLRGLVIIFAFVVFAAIFHLDTILWILGKIATIAVTALIIIFQPELRRALEQLGSRNFLVSLFQASERESESAFSEHTLNEMVKASFDLAKARTGALMVIEQTSSLKDIERTGINIEAVVSSQLLINIFEHNTPLHDGAVIIRGNTIVAATCYLPLSDDMRISKNLGTRHRAAIGISEVTDSLTIVVSEETGDVSVARGGRLQIVSSPEELKDILDKMAGANIPVKRFRLWKGRTRNEGKTD